MEEWLLAAVPLTVLAIASYLMRHRDGRAARAIGAAARTKNRFLGH